jgi:2-haloacid dehalogenase
VVKAVVFDVGNVLYDWSPRFLYEKLIDDPRALDWFLDHVVTHEWHFQHDAGRDFADTSAERIAQFPEQAGLIRLFAPRFNETIRAPIPGALAIVRALDDAGIPLFAITNFSHEFFPPFRALHAEIFDRFRDIVVSGDERLVKPDPAIYALALARFGLAADEALFVDDRADNVAAAQENGFIGHHFVDAATLRLALHPLI